MSWEHYEKLIQAEMDELSIRKLEVPYILKTTPEVLAASAFIGAIAGSICGIIGAFVGAETFWAYVVNFLNFVLTGALAGPLYWLLLGRYISKEKAELRIEWNWAEKTSDRKYYLANSIRLRHIPPRAIRRALDRAKKEEAKRIARRNKQALTEKQEKEKAEIQAAQQQEEYAKYFGATDSKQQGEISLAEGGQLTLK